MRKSTLWIAAMVFASACSSVAEYPSEWHDAGDSIHVFGAVPAKTVTVSEDMTVLDVFFGLGEARGDASRVMVFRRTDEGLMRVDVDVREMLLTGNAAANIQLRPGDVVRVAG